MKTGKSHHSEYATQRQRSDRNKSRRIAAQRGMLGDGTPYVQLNGIMVTPLQAHNYRNRSRRIVRRLVELNNDKAIELKAAQISQREPVLADIDAQIQQLRIRQQVLHSMLEVA